MKWKRIRNALVCAAVGAVLPTMAKADLVGYWSFDDATVEDASGFGNNGTLMGGVLPSFSSDVPTQLSGGRSILFGGGDSHVLVPDSDSLDISSAITLAAWVKPTTTGWDGILAKSPSDGSVANHAGNFELRIADGSRLINFLHQQGGANDTIGGSSTASVLTNVWQHIAVTGVSGGPLTFYINGTAAGTTTLSPSFGPINSNPLYIGSRADLFTGFDGLLDDVRVYNEALTASQIQDLAGGALETYEFLAGVRAQASSQYLPDGRLAANAVNGNGLLGKSHGTSPGGAMWLTDGADLSPEFTIDLGAVHRVDDLRVWNYNEDANPTCCLDRGVRTADIYVAGADGVFGATPVIAGQTFTRAPGTLSDFSQVVSLGGTQARYIKLAVTANHGDASFTGLSEVGVTGSVVSELAPIPTTVASASSSLGGNFNRLASLVTDGSGLGFADTHSSVPDGSMWLTVGTFAGSDTSPEITFDLGSERALSHMRVWNYNEYRPDLPDRIQELLGRGVRETDVLIAGEDGVFFPLYEALELERAPEVGDTIDISQSIDFGGVVARYVKLDILSNYNGRDFRDPLDDDALANFVGLSEVQFFGVVPEPTTGLLGTAALITLFGMRRRQGA